MQHMYALPSHCFYLSFSSSFSFSYLLLRTPPSPSLSHTIVTPLPLPRTLSSHCIPVPLGHKEFQRRPSCQGDTHNCMHLLPLPHRSISLSVCLSLPLCLSVCLSVCLFVCRTPCLSPTLSQSPFLSTFIPIDLSPIIREYPCTYFYLNRCESSLSNHYLPCDAPTRLVSLSLALNRCC
jgi:hypothetical protein